MSELFKTLLVNDEILDIDDVVAIEVCQSTTSKTVQAIPVTNPSTSGINCQVKVPTVSTMVDRRIINAYDISFTFNITGVPSGSLAMNLGVSDSLAPFPYNKLVTNHAMQINNNSVTIPLQQMIDPMIYCAGDQESEYWSMCPSMLDSAAGFYSYADGVGSNSNALAGASNRTANGLFGRGSYAMIEMSVVHTITASGTDASLLSTNVADTWIVTISYRIQEPFWGLSPIAANNEYQKPALIGINTLSYTATLDSDCKRVWSSANNYITKISCSFPNMAFLMTYYTLPATAASKLNLRQVLPYSKHVYDITNINSTVAAATGGTGGAASVPGTGSQNSNQITGAQVPSYIVIAVRKKIQSQTWADSASFLPITSINLTYNNNASICANFTPMQLWKQSVDAGLKDFPFHLFRGYMSVASSDGKSKQVPSTGSIVILRAADLNLPVELSSGSACQSSFFYTVNFSNYSSTAFVNNLELLTYQIWDGICINELGNTDFKTGLLSVDTVLKTKEGFAKDDNIYPSDIEHVLGGSGIFRGERINKFARTLRRGLNKAKDAVSGLVGGGDVGGGNVGGMGYGGGDVGGRRYARSH